MALDKETRDRVKANFWSLRDKSLKETIKIRWDVQVLLPFLRSMGNFASSGLA